jgi:hypothetical protein
MRGLSAKKRMVNTSNQLIFSLNRPGVKEKRFKQIINALISAAQIDSVCPL